MINTITINAETCSAAAPPLYQYDYGQSWQIEGLELPQTFEVDFATIDSSASVTVIGENGIVQLPDQLLDLGIDIVGYIYLHSDETDGYTEYVITQHVISRQSRTDEQPTPQEQTLIEQAITVLNHAVEQTASDVEAAQQAAEDAEAAAQTATEAVQTATDAAYRAESSATAAAQSASAAEISATQAGLSANSAAASATSAAQSASDAQSAVASIGDSVTRAESAASTATGAAQTASTKASEANTSAGVAASNATTATVKAQEAAQSTTQAAQSATAAQTAQTGAEAAQTAAETAQTAAESAASSAEAEAGRAEGYANRLTDFLPTDTASGPIASFPDGADDVPVKSLVVNIEPVQSGSGDPSPDNVRPITGWDAVTVTGCGVNLWDGLYEGGYYDISDGEKKGNPSSTTGWQRSKNIIPCAPNTAYRFIKAAAPETGAPGYMLFYDRSGNYLNTYSQLTSVAYNGGIVFTTPADCYGIAFYNNIGWFIDHDISINYPATDTDYHAYSGETYDISWESEAGTVYGGTLTYEGDGVWTLVSNMALADLGTLNCVAWAGDSTGHTFATEIATKSQTGQNVLCSSYKTIQNASAQWGVILSYDKAVFAPLNGAWVLFRDSACSTAADFKAAVTGQQLVYPLATPQTYTLTTEQVVTLLGQNNFWADCGDISVEYRADIQKYILKIVAAALNT